MLEASGELVRVRPIGPVLVAVAAALTGESTERTKLAFLRHTVAVRIGPRSRAAGALERMHALPQVETHLSGVAARAHREGGLAVPEHVIDDPGPPDTPP